MSDLLAKIKQIKEVNAEKEKKGIVNLSKTELDQEYLKELSLGFSSYIEYLNSNQELKEIVKNKELYSKIEFLTDRDKDKVLKFIDMLED